MLGIKENLYSPVYLLTFQLQYTIIPISKFIQNLKIIYNLKSIKIVSGFKDICGFNLKSAIFKFEKRNSC